MTRDLRTLCPDLAVRRDIGSWRWFARDAADECWIDALTERLADDAGAARFVIRDAGVSRFVKRTPLIGLRRKLRARLGLRGLRSGTKGPVREAFNSLAALRAGAPVPALLAVGAPARAGPRRECVLVFEALESVRTLAECLESSATPEPLLHRAGALAQDLLRLPFVHLDFNGNNVLLSGAGAGGDRVVDFEICGPAPADRSGVLAFYLGNLWRRGVSGHVRRARYDACFARGLMAERIEAPALPRALELYEEFQTVRHRYRQRRRMLSD